MFSLVCVCVCMCVIVYVYVVLGVVTKKSNLLFITSYFCKLLFVCLFTSYCISEVTSLLTVLLYFPVS